MSLENAVIARAAMDLGLVSKLDVVECERAAEQEEGKRAPSLIGILLDRRLITAQDVIRIVERAREIGPGGAQELKISPEVRPLLSTVPEEVKEVISDPDRYLGNRYILIRRLGEGYYGEVWKAWDALLGRPVAVKFTLRRGQEEIKRFQQEALLAAKLSHPGIANIYEAGHFGNTWFIAMEFIEGTPLDKLVNSRPPELARRLAYLRDAALAIDYAHRHGVVHRDITPWNIMVDDSHRVFILDFGLAKSLEVRINLTKVGESVGAIYFASPEQAGGPSEAIGIRSDIYMLGASLYFLLTGCFPFDGLDLESVRRQVIAGALTLPSRRVSDGRLIAEVDWIVAKAMAREPEERFGSAADLAEALQQTLRRMGSLHGDAPFILNPEIESYLSQLCERDGGARREMEEMAARRKMPVPGPLVGRALFVLAKLGAARRVAELGGGIGYVSSWLLRAMPEEGRLVFIEKNADNAALARVFFEKMGCADRVDVRVGDALEILDGLEGPFDLIYNNVEESLYPAVFAKALPRLRKGGLLVSDNVLIRGRAASEPPDAATAGVREYNRLAHETAGVCSFVIPLHDGLGVSLHL